MRILILRGGALGDFLVTTPALRSLRLHWPEATIELVGNPRAGELGVLSGYLDSVHSEHDARWSPLFTHAPLPVSLSQWLDAFDLVLNFWPDPDGSLKAHFAHRGASYLSSELQGFTRPAARRYCEALKALGVESADFQARIEIPARLREEAARRIGSFHDFVAIHPGSASRSKNWPAGSWTALCERMHLPILAITGEAELTEPLVVWPEDLFVQRAHQWPLPLLAGALLRSRRYIGHDTGISHLAAALGLPTIVLFGPTDPAIWAPQGPNVAVVKKGPAMTDISVDDVYFAIDEQRR